MKPARKPPLVLSFPHEVLLICFIGLAAAPRLMAQEDQPQDLGADANGRVMDAVDETTLLRSSSYLYETRPRPDASPAPDSGAGTALLLREIVTIDVSSAHTVEANAYISLTSGTLESDWTQPPWPGPLHRDGRMERTWYSKDQTEGRWVLDQLHYTYRQATWSARIGRQAVNLATTFYFTPNDLFGGFHAGTVYRDYKPGVDALRADFNPDPLTEITLLHVLGYRADLAAGGDTDHTEHAPSKGATLLRYGTNVDGSHIYAFGGLANETLLLGGSFQATLPWEVGLRLEAHHRTWNTNNGDGRRTWDELVVGFDRWLSPRLLIRGEYFRHGAGTDKVDDYVDNPLFRADMTGAYLGRDYLAVGGSFEWTPLLSGQAMVLANLNDGSSLATLYHKYSLSNEADLGLMILKPQGRGSTLEGPRSEYGSYPATLQVDTSVYF